jgi:hypothetical protein
MKSRFAAAWLTMTGWTIAAVLLVAPRAASAQASPDSAAFTHHDSTATAAPTTPPPATPPPATPPPAAASAHATASPGSAKVAGMFSKGNRRVNATAGWGHSFDTDYLLLGVGVGYYIANGLDVGMDFEGWLIGDPTIYKLSPRADYVLWKAKRIKPYAGAFYRWNFIGNGIDDKNSLGGRAGAFYQGRGRGMAGAGVVYERYLNLDERLGSSDVLYPEIFVSVSF